MRYNTHHIHKRKRIYKKLEKYPHQRKLIRFFDKFILTIAVIGPLLTLPQIAKIFVLKDVAGLSIITWSLYTLFIIPWIIYGFLHKEKPIIISSVLWIMLDSFVVAGILLYS